VNSHELRADALRNAAPALPPQAAWQQLHAGASERYRSGGRFAYHFARGKLGRDPVFRALLQLGAVPPQARVLDIGCGQGLLASLLAACDAMAAAHRWPGGWGAAPVHTRYTGIDLMPRDIARAQQALAGLTPPPTLLCGDMCSTPFPPCDVVVVLDVLHYVDIAAQDDVLARVRAALGSGGRLLLRVGDASQRWGFAASQWVDRIVTSVRGHRAPPTYGRTLEQWRAALQALGFTVQPLPMSRGTPFANVLLRCTLPESAR
jgi:SAM-dependent methyltransferase